MPWLIRASYAGQQPKTFCTTRQRERAAALADTLERTRRFASVALV